MAKKNRVVKFFEDHIALWIILAVTAICVIFPICSKTAEDGSRTFDGSKAVIDQSTIDFIEDNKDIIAGMFVKHDGGSGAEQTPQMGTFPYYKVDVSTPDAFYNAVVGKGFDEGWGKQCVAGFKEYQYSLSGKVVATSTGGASGYANQQSQIEPLGFTWHAGSAGLQNGDWGIFGGGLYGHVAMYYNGQWFGQNQNTTDTNAGTPFNLAYIGTANLIGYYRPNIYASVAPTPEPTPEPTPVSYDSYTVVHGDTLGGITIKMGWCNGCKLYGDDGYCQRLADYNGIVDRGLIYPGQVIKQAK